MSSLLYTCIMYDDNLKQTKEHDINNSIRVN